MVTSIWKGMYRLNVKGLENNSPPYQCSKLISKFSFSLTVKTSSLYSTYSTAFRKKRSRRYKIFRHQTVGHRSHSDFVTSQGWTASYPYIVVTLWTH